MLKNVLQICFVCVLNGILTSGQGRGVKKLPTKWSTNILQDGVSVISLKTIEPGFDLTDEEIKKFKLWPNGIIPYYIDEFSFDKVLRDRIRSFIDVFGGLTGLYFLELDSPPMDLQERWVIFLNRRGILGCADHNAVNFTTEGVQRVILGYDCICNGAELSEVAMAIAGVPAQHNSPDRDRYITVKMDKIIPEKRYLFKKLDNRDWLFHDLNYDFSSVSHYHFHKHSIDGAATIIPNETPEISVGEGDGLSYTDVLKVRMLYNYISKKKNNVAKAPKCNKLFKPGSKFNKYRPQIDDTKPRPKPNKYLGLPDDNNDTPKKKLSNSTQNENIPADADTGDEVKQADSEDSEDDQKIDDKQEKRNDPTVALEAEEGQTKNPDNTHVTLKRVDPLPDNTRVTLKRVYPDSTRVTLKRVYPDSTRVTLKRVDPFLDLSDYVHEY